MCIVFWKLLNNSLVLAFNRDEYFLRPTLGFHYWSTHPTILAPQDLHPPPDQRGTYLGASPHSRRLAFLTNFRELPSPAKLSRGPLVRDYLLTPGTALNYAQAVYEQRHQYNGFNLVLFDLDKGQVVYVTNRGYEGEGAVKVLVESGVMGLSNSTIDDRSWPKVEQGKQAFAQALESSRDEQSLISNLMRVMSDPGPFTSSLPQCLDDLQQCIYVPELSNIDGLPSVGQYGTRTTDVIILTNSQLTIAERNHDGSIQTFNVEL
ncbi:hypothetical protein IWW37_004402 [Coemansia sp. RSA 2050]|nr:hypothetical protein IWW37_004402 [Coemansia sp. RSA 2050]KAJ2731508.1 hypothetical protein IW152_004481 [Coemansia sp. BCRC 34962]